MTRSAVAGSEGYVDRDDESGREGVLAPAERERWPGVLRMRIADERHQGRISEHMHTSFSAEE